MSTMEVFSPFRVVGSVCRDVPAAFTLLYEQPVLMVACGRTFQLFRGNELSMLRGGPTFEHDIAAVAQEGKFRFVAEGSRVHAFCHHKALWTKEHSPIAHSAVTHLMARDELVLSVGEDGIVVVWDIKTGDRLREFPIANNERALCLVLAEGYNNKILLGTRDGSVHLYNFVKGTLLFRHEVPEATATATTGTGRPQVLCLATCGYRDIVAYGTSDGRAIVYNYGTDAEIATFRHAGVSVTAVAFRVDRDGVLVTGTSSGEVAIWDLATRQLEGIVTRTKQVRSLEDVIDTPHTDTVHTIVAFPKTQVLVTAGADNALVQFRFDTIDGMGLLVRERRGHSGPCTVAHFYNGDLLVTAGTDHALRTTHIFSDRASWELSQGKMARRQKGSQLSRDQMKLPAARAIASATTRNYQWASVVAIHDCSAQMSAWRMDTRAMDGKHSGIATSIHSSRCVTVSACGCFAVIGYTSGNLVSIHLQNRSIKQFLVPDSDTAHSGAVESVQVACGNTVVVSCGADGRMMLWDLLATRLLRIITLDVAATSASALHPESSLLIAAGVDHQIRVYNCTPDAADGTALRVFRGHQAAVTTLAITPDTFQHVVSASADGAVLVWDLAAGACVGAYRVPSPVSSLSFHPDALFIATTHSGEAGAFLWTNNLRYGYAPEVVTEPWLVPVADLPLLHYPVGTREVSDEALLQPAAAAVAADQQQKSALEAEGAADEEEGVDLYDEAADVAVMQRQREAAEWGRLDAIPASGITAAGVPASVWQSIGVLDHIKEKNKPLLPPSKKSVPFFLTTTAEPRPTFVIQLEKDAATVTDGTAAANGTTAGDAPLSDWQAALLGGQFDDCLRYFVENHSTAAEIDTEVRTLVRVDEGLLNTHAAFAPERLKTKAVQHDAADGSKKVVVTTSTTSGSSQGPSSGPSDNTETYADGELRTMVNRLASLIAFLAHHTQQRTATDLVAGILSGVLRAHGSAITRLAAFKDSEYRKQQQQQQQQAGGPLVKQHHNALAAALDALVTEQAALRATLDHITGLPGCLVSAFTNSF